MTVTTTTYTTNSRKITVSNEIDSIALISAVDAAIVALGWTQYDFIDTDEYSPIETFVYRCLNADGITYKYWIIRWDTIKLVYYTSTCEDWNISTNVPTNESWTNAGAFQQGYTIKDGFIFVSATNRHIMMQNFILNRPGLWSAVFEFERIAAEDTTGANVPCWGWTNSLMFGTSWGMRGAGASRMMIAFPRLADGSTGSSAAQKMVTVTARGPFPPSLPLVYTTAYLSGITGLYTSSPNYLHLSDFYRGNYGWDSSRTLVSSISMDSTDSLMPLGRGYNIGITKPLGSFLDTANVKIDNSGGWPSSDGANAECLLLNLNGGPEVTGSFANPSQPSIFTSYGSGRLGNTASATAPGNTRLGRPVAIGDAVYIASSNGLYNYSQSTGANGPISLVGPNSHSISDIMYDGRSTIYGALSNGVFAFNVDNSAFTYVATLGEGAVRLNMDNKFVYVTASRAANTLPRVYAIFKSNNTLKTNSFIANTNGGTANVSQWWTSPVPDYTGNVFISETATAESANKRFWKYNAANEGIRHVVGDGAGYVGRASQRWVGNQPYYDVIERTLYQLVDNAATAVTVYKINPITLAHNNQPHFSTATTSSAFTIESSYFSSIYGTHLIPIRGVFNFASHKHGVYSNSGYRTGVVFNHPTGLANGNSVLLWAFANNHVFPNVVVNPMGVYSGIDTDGSTIYTTFGASDTTQRLYVIDNLYPLLNTNGDTTGRLILKG